MPDRITLAPDTNQALGLAQYAIEFMSSGEPGCNLTTDLHYFERCQRSIFVDALLQRWAASEWHHQVGQAIHFSDLIDVNDIVM